MLKGSKEILNLGKVINDQEAYLNVKGKEVPAKQIKDFKNCAISCKFKCFYKMSQNEKYHFLLNTTSRDLTERPKDKTRISSYKQFSFKYFFNVGSSNVKVCKRFYLGTLDIPQKPVYTVHKTKMLKQIHRNKTDVGKVQATVEV